MPYNYSVAVGEKLDFHEPVEQGVLRGIKAQFKNLINELKYESSTQTNNYILTKQLLFFNQTSKRQVTTIDGIQNTSQGYINDVGSLNLNNIP